MDLADAYPQVALAALAARVRDRCANVRFPWYADEPAKACSQGSLFDHAGAAPVKFHSGSSSFWDLRGCVLAGAPVGLTATAVGKASGRRTLRHARDYASRGGMVFCDSGAFGAFVAGRALDFEADVFPVYEQLLQGCKAPDNLHFVMPDVVGDPEASLALQLANAERLRGWMRSGVRCLFPLHSPTDDRFFDAIKAIAQGCEFTVAVPSNLEAWSLPELVRFCQRHEPARIHLLGLGNARGVDAVCDALARVSPLTQISCDSCTWLAHVGEGRRLTDRTRTRLRDAVRWVMEDSSAEAPFPTLSTYMTQALWTPNFLDERFLPGIARLFEIDEQHLIQAARTQGLLAVLGSLDPDDEWMQDVLREHLREHVYGVELARILRGPIRALEVARLAGLPAEEAEHDASRAPSRHSYQGS